MCGIYGIAGPRAGDVPEDLADSMRESLKHRGPDHAGSYRGPGVILGINRLAIVDLETGNQPIFNEDRTLVIVYNGELYNHLDLRRELETRGHRFRTQTDTETVLHAFEEYGEECLVRFNGMFALAIWNVRDKTLFLARDRLGIKPLYVARSGRRTAFASEPKALLPFMPHGPRPNWSAIYRFFSFGYIPSVESALAGIQKFPPGHFAWVEGSRFRIRRYWAPEYGQGNDIGFERASSALHEHLDRAVRSELMSDVPLGVFLSGGLDSSAVAVFAKKHATTPLHSFSLRFNETTHDESADARLVAEHLGLQHHELVLSEEHLHRALAKAAAILDEPFGDCTVLPLLALSEFAREHVRVVLTGWGGDEVFAGYPTYRAHRLARWYRHLPGLLGRRLIPAVVNRLPVSDKYMSFEFKARRFIKGMDLPPEHQHFTWMGYFDDAGKTRLFRSDILEQMDGDTLGPLRDVVETLPERDIVDRVMHLDALFFLEGNGLYQADRMTMAASLEARVPLLNHDLLAFVNALPIHVKAKGGRLKELLRRTMAPHLPDRILNKPKKGFGPPSSVWTRQVFSNVLDRQLSRERVEAQGVFNAHEVRRLMAEHRARKADHGRKLWALLSFQLWYDKWILEQQRPCSSPSRPASPRTRVALHSCSGVTTGR